MANAKANVILVLILGNDGQAPEYKLYQDDDKDKDDYTKDDYASSTSSDQSADANAIANANASANADANVAILIIQKEKKDEYKKTDEMAGDY